RRKIKERPKKNLFEPLSLFNPNHHSHQSHPMKRKSASQSAFFKLRILLGVLLCFAAVTIVLLAQPRTPSGQSGSSQPIISAEYRGLMQVVKFDVSPPLRDMKPMPWTHCTKS